MSLFIECTLEPQGPATAIELSAGQLAELGGGSRAPVLVTIAGRTARLRVARMGGRNLIGLSRAARAQLGVAIGDRVSAEVALDTAERTVEVPPALREALDRVPGASERYARLSCTRRREIAAGITGAKRPETRARRIEAALAETGVTE